MTCQDEPVADGGSSADRTIQAQQLFVKHQSAVKAFILSLRPDFAEAEDILQEVFLTVTRKANEFRPNSSFTAWAFAIARLKVLEAQRRRQRRGTVSLSEEVIEMLIATAPEESFFESRLEMIRKCIEKLAPRAQEIVRLRYHGEHAPNEIARQLDWKPDAVNVALSKARVVLRECVERGPGRAA
jgi:RNA polymerase sigma-70 factor (ECF subfamily)